MLYGILATLLCILGLFIILLVMVQRGHGGFFTTGPSSSESSAVFGGSGGSDILQKITWICGFLLIISSFSLAIYRTRIAKQGKYGSREQVMISATSSLREKEESSEKEGDEISTEEDENEAAD